MTHRRSPSRRDQPELNLLAYALVVWNRRRLIAAVVSVTLAGVLVTGILSTRIYVSTATVLAPSESRGGGMAGVLAATAMLPAIPGLTPGGLTPNRDIFLSIMKSRTMAEEAVKRFELTHVLGLAKASAAVRRLQDSVTVTIAKEGVLSVKVELPNAQLAADVANFYCANLDRMMSKFSTTEAGKQRTFIDERLRQTLKELEKNENALMQFQELHKAIALQEQAKGAVEAAAKLRGEIVAGEVQLEVLRNYATETNPEVINLKRRVEEMKRQLIDLRYGKEWEVPGKKTKNADLICDDLPIEVTYTEFAELGLDLARLTREVKVQETVYAMLTQQLEQVKIAEAKDVPAVQVLDLAVPADRHTKPKILANLVLGGFTSLLLAVFAAFFLEYLRNQRRLLSAAALELEPEPLTQTPGASGQEPAPPGKRNRLGSAIGRSREE